MGYNSNTWFYFNKCLKKVNFLIGDKLPEYGKVLDNEPYCGKYMLELGCQVFRGHIRKRMDSGKYRHVVRKYFQSIGVGCISVDITGCLGALKKDLREPMGMHFYDKFDIVTNLGTTEHIFPVEGQYEAFKNIHKCVKKEGIMIHVLPIYKEDQKHGEILYKDKFFTTLARLNNYEIINMEKYDRKRGDIYWCICFRKQEDSKFTTRKNKFNKYLELNNG